MDTKNKNAEQSSPKSQNVSHRGYAHWLSKVSDMFHSLADREYFKTDHFDSFYIELSQAWEEMAMLASHIPPGSLPPEDLEDMGYPPALAKACMDPFQYAMRLRTGELIEFSSAEAVSREWVLLKVDDPSECTNPLPFYRGVNIRLSDIVWVTDAPHGS